MQPGLFARNGRIVSAKYQSDIAALANQLARFRSKEFYRSPGDVTGPATDKILRFAGVTGPLARTVVARILMAPPSSQTTQTKNPKATLTLYDTSGNVIGSGSAFWGYSYGKVSLNTPDEWGLASIGVDVSNYQSTIFRAELRADDEARPISCTVYEATALPDTEPSGSSGVAYVPQQYSVGQPINDQDRQDIYDLALALYKYNGPSLFTWSSQTDASAISTPSPRNILDNQLLGLNTNRTAGFTIDLRYCARKTTTTVPVRLDVYAKMSDVSAGPGSVQVYGEPGTAIGSGALVSATTAQWSSVTLNLPATLATYYVAQNSANGLQNVTTYAVSCFRYQ